MPTRQSAKKTPHKWSAGVTSDSTHPREGLFNESAQTIADELFSEKVSPKGPASGMQMLNFYINRAGKNLSEERLKVLEHAKEILSAKIAAAKPAAH
jgi:tRNA(adenine34) deaminase